VASHNCWLQTASLTGRKISIVVLGQARWTVIKPHTAEIVAAVDAATPGSFAEVEIPFR
jgi:hypothetical protein